MKIVIIEPLGITRDEIQSATSKCFCRPVPEHCRGSALFYPPINCP
ncbi:hypothetical protein OQJ18_14085 [Fluoribacter dumoffii]|nr:hypothetical protein [Fluoribacter dumoffii]MCW8387682.1 hypothetical protein [Fluoribacter dumoffii]MCW8416772.1 hypothetical protein [Fluoribacter dumoffii]MCW8455388.1 hypothetical protein [Fluoribacter dumoffii]MCW8460534.1 hypothetical protein [Fluoribacter dumoffii]MCW8484015.1 hypothetical protein [Fluoribacter dumoffii]